MSLQWTAVAIFLYMEVGILSLFLLPWIRPQMWNKLFKSRLVKAIESYSYVYSIAFAGVLSMLFLDGLREVRKYSAVDPDLSIAPGAEAIIHMKLFRAQRNLYISGMALFLWMVIRRTMDLLRHNAQLGAGADAALKQAKSASAAAQGILDNTDLEDMKKKFEKSEIDKKAVLKQAEGLKNEYDNLLERYKQLESQTQFNGSSDKKDD